MCRRARRRWPRRMLAWLRSGSLLRRRRQNGWRRKRRWNLPPDGGRHQIFAGATGTLEPRCRVATRRVRPLGQAPNCRLHTPTTAPRGLAGADLLRLARALPAVARAMAVAGPCGVYWRRANAFETT